jgi:hypothetical protein
LCSSKKCKNFIIYVKMCLKLFVSVFSQSDFVLLVNTVRVVNGSMAVVEAAVVNAHAVKLDFPGRGVRNGIVLVSYGRGRVVNLCGQTSERPGLEVSVRRGLGQSLDTRSHEKDQTHERS